MLASRLAHCFPLCLQWPKAPELMEKRKCATQTPHRPNFTQSRHPTSKLLGFGLLYFDVFAYFGQHRRVHLLKLLETRTERPENT